jgi:hypothetical protein
MKPGFVRNNRSSLGPGCSGSQPPFGAPGVMKQSRAITTTLAAADRNGIPGTL